MRKVWKLTTSEEIQDFKIVMKIWTSSNFLQADKMADNIQLQLTPKIHSFEGIFSFELVSLT